MPLRIERDPAWWTAIAAHPRVAPFMGGIDPALVGALAARPEFIPLASANGGFLLHRRDEFGLVWELHTLFTPEGWGREAVTAGIEGLNLMFGANARVIVTLETQANPRSRPWRRFGFEPAGPYAATPMGEFRPWVLTQAAWVESRAAAARRRVLN